jgi:hypothetical protein
LLGRDDLPATLDGYGPIDPVTARTLAGHAPSFIRLLTHPETGAVLSVGRDNYRVPQDLKNWLRCGMSPAGSPAAPATTTSPICARAITSSNTKPTGRSPSPGRHREPDLDLTSRPGLRHRTRNPHAKLTRGVDP